MTPVNGTELDIDTSDDMPFDEVSRPAVVETKGSWTCPECATENNPNTFPERLDLDACFECGTAKPAAVADPAEPQPTPAGKLEDVPLPLDDDGDTDDDKGEGFERFNANKAMSTIIAKNTEVQVARDTYDRLKKAAAEAKKELDQDEAALGRIITGFSRAREAQNGPQALLPLNGQPAAVESNCPWERDNPGFVCVVCREAKRHKLNPDVNSEVHPEHTGHEDVADKAHTEKVLKPLIPALKAKNVIADVLELQALDGAELQQLLDWVDQNGIVPPAILATAHVADVAGTLAQVCQNCNTVLADATDEEGFYPEGALVGFDCDVKLEQVAKDAIDEVVPVEPVEAARKPKSHAKKNAGKKREPEQDRAHQVAAGKAKTAKKAPKSKVQAAKKGRTK